MAVGSDVKPTKRALRESARLVRTITDEIEVATVYLANAAPGPTEVASMHALVAAAARDVQKCVPPFELTHEKVFEKIAVAISPAVTSSTTADATDGMGTTKQMAWLSGARTPEGLLTAVDKRARELSARNASGGAVRD